MQACAILVLIYVATTILSTVVRMTKIVVIRVTMVIVYLSGTPPGFSLSARFLAGPHPSEAGVPKNPAILKRGCAPLDVFSETYAGRAIPPRRSWPNGAGLCRPPRRRELTLFRLLRS
jgi:hypothetical protein